MIRLKFVPRSLGASGCFLPLLDHCLELSPEILFLRIGECTGRTFSGVTAPFIPPSPQSAVGRSGSALRVLFKDLGMNLALFGDLRLRSNLKTYDDVRVAVDTIPVLLLEDSTENIHKVAVEVRVSVQRRQRIGRPLEVVPIEPMLWVVTR
jgi:hypothetical protein